MTTNRSLDISSIIVICLASVLILFIPAAGAEISYTFDIDTKGNAWYIIEYRILLDSQDRINEFDEFKLVVEGNNTHKAEFEARMQDIVTKAGIATSRPMVASDFDVSVTTRNSATGNYGIVRYSFKWSHLADVSGSSIILGDVFFGGQYISNGDAFIVKVPAGYKVSGEIPKPDVQREDELIWNGPRTFNSGEPGVTFDKETSWLMVAGILVLLLVAAAAIIFLKKKYSKGSSNAPVKPLKLVEMQTEELESPELSQPSGSVGTILESDEDMIISMLREAGGAMMQSEIVKRSGFSKSKTSALLNRMAEDGLIQRVKKGRENLVRLT